MGKKQEGVFIVAPGDPLYDLVRRYRNGKPMFEVVILGGVLQGVNGLPDDANYRTMDYDNDPDGESIFPDNTEEPNEPR